MIDIRIGDSRQLVHDLDDSSIDCVMTSPPYWGLRDYGHDDQIGLEETPEQYLNDLVRLFSNVKAKLKDSGNCFVNLGDTYMSSGGASRHQGYSDPKYSNGRNGNHTEPHAYKHDVLQPKSLAMIPERFAWQMIQEGWILRNKIIWYKPNHMPESVTDRLTKSYEVIYHFVKSQKYHYDLDAIREPHQTQENRPSGMKRSRDWGYNGKYKGCAINPESSGSPRARTQRKYNDSNSHYGGGGSKIRDASGGVDGHPLGKNPGDVWHINTKPYPEAHFAVYPLELLRRPILAGCPEGGMVLDPFGGSGTTAEFCRKNQRDCIIFELNENYKPLIEKRSMSKIPDIFTFKE